jgi:hypothetical protein
MSTTERRSSGYSIDSSFNQRALLLEDREQAPIDLNSLLPVDSHWYLLSPGGITNSGEIAATAVDLNTFELDAVVVSPIAGVGPAARGTKKPPALPDNVRKRFQGSLRNSNQTSKRNRVSIRPGAVERRKQNFVLKEEFSGTAVA